MNGTKPLKGTIEQTAETISLALKKITGVTIISVIEQ